MVCGVLRDDADIGVSRRDVSSEMNPPLPPGTVVRNARYCADKAACLIGSLTLKLWMHREPQAPPPEEP